MLLYLHICIVHFFQDMSSDIHQYMEFSTVHMFAYIFHHCSLSPFFSGRRLCLAPTIREPLSFGHRKRTESSGTPEPLNKRVELFQ
jgi:hypothetical protein